MKEVYLWTMYKAATNSPNDVWKESDIPRHPHFDKSSLGQPKLRYTIPIFLLGKTKNDEKILLMLQSTSDETISFSRFVIESDAFSQSLGIEIEYIYQFNIRLGLSSEFKSNKDGTILDYGKVKKAYRTNIYNKSISLIKGTP